MPLQPSKQASRASPPSRPASSQSTNQAEADTMLQTLSNTSSARSSRDPLPDIEEDTDLYSMSMPDRTQHFNKQSCKVNAGLTFGGATYDGEETVSPAAFLNALPEAVANFDFSVFVVPRSTPKPRISAQLAQAQAADIVKRLLNPPAHAFVHGVLSLNWVISVAGSENFECRPRDGRFVLKRTSVLRSRGRELGLPAAYAEWLCGDEEGGSASEQGLLLTREFFEKEV
jgi:hypothetical protein